MDTLAKTRRKIRVRGVVQGVGFRPFVYRLAHNHGLAGWVRNTSGCVEIEVEGPLKSIDAFISALWTEAPELARIDSLSAIEADLAGYDKFEIIESKPESSASGIIPVDVATCSDCLRELAEPSDRRFEYPFINCTNCGPRFTIVQRVPYDRTNTTMASFKMCPNCEREYTNPVDRRFHAEPIACPVCGPKVWLEVDGIRQDRDALKAAAALLSDGKIVAIKGLGGFHLACDAASDSAVGELRSRKGRKAKPFALMVRDINEARKLCEIDSCAEKFLLSNRRPIVLCPKREEPGVSELVAPGNRLLGLMLPYTPLHSLLTLLFQGALVMTSANLSEEPLVFTNDSARSRLVGLADAFLMHDRDIQVPCDDSVVRPVGNGDVIMVRRARGYVPGEIDVPGVQKAVLGTGAEQKNTFCIAFDGKAVPSQHIGDLDTSETFDYYRYAIDHFGSLLGRSAEIVAHDLHPDYLSTRYAVSTPNARLVPVQHHHAHIAACLAENGRDETCIGLALDGTGFGTDGTVWGGEILIANLKSFERAGHFEQVRMPGGEAAIRDPRRMALAYLHAAYGDEFESVAERLGIRMAPLEMSVIRRQLETGLNSPVTSSAGRLFDAVSAAVGICPGRDYEGQPAIALEMAAVEGESGVYPYEIAAESNPIVLSTIPIFKAAAEDRLADVAQGVIAAKFHNTIVQMLACVCDTLRERSGIGLVALSGGVFQNAILHVNVRDELVGRGFEVIVHRQMPPNDACISLGQVAVAAAAGGGS